MPFENINLTNEDVWIIMDTKLVNMFIEKRTIYPQIGAFAQAADFYLDNSVNMGIWKGRIEFFGFSSHKLVLISAR